MPRLVTRVKVIGGRSLVRFSVQPRTPYFFNSQSVSRYATKVGLTTEASLTGNGDGIHIEPGFDVKEPVRKVLGKVGVLDLVRRYRSRGSWQSPDAEYSRDDDLHSLFVVLGKPGDPSLQLRGTPS